MLKPDLSESASEGPDDTRAAFIRTFVARSSRLRAGLYDSDRVFHVKHAYLQPADGQKATPSQSAGPLVEFVLRHLHVKTNVCSRQKHEHGYALERRTIPDYNLIYVTRGRPVWVIEQTEYPLSPGRLLVVPPGKAHHAYCPTPRVTIGSIHVEAMLSGTRPSSTAIGAHTLETPSEVFDLLGLPPLHRFEPGTALDRYLRGALAEFDRASFNDVQLAMQPWARLIMMELLRDASGRGVLEPRRMDPVVATILEELTRRLDRRTTLDDLARRSGYSAQHLNRLFRHVLGVTPLQYLARLRMEKAAQLLIESPLTVAGVAQAVGFDDPYYFSRAFKEHMGSSPAQYRDAADSDSPSSRSGNPLPSQ